MRHRAASQDRRPVAPISTETKGSTAETSAADASNLSPFALTESWAGVYHGWNSSHMEPNAEVGQRIAKAREFLGLTQAVIAEKLGLARTTQVAIEQGRR